MFGMQARARISYIIAAIMVKLSCTDIKLNFGIELFEVFPTNETTGFTISIYSRS